MLDSKLDSMLEKMLEKKLGFPVDQTPITLTQLVLSRVVKDEFRFLVAFIVHCRSNFTSDSSGSLTFLGETIDYKMTSDPFVV